MLPGFRCFGEVIVACVLLTHIILFAGRRVIVLIAGSSWTRSLCSSFGRNAKSGKTARQSGADGAAVRD